MTPVLDIRSLDAGYRGAPVVRGLDMHVDRGEVVALLGPNGAGKTTTLLTVSAMLPILSGSVHIMGESVGRAKPHQIARRGVAHVPEDRALFFEQTVVENLKLGRRRGRVDIARALAYFPALEPLLGRKAGLLSGGEQQMLALGRALISNPTLLMVDEMSLGLAPVIVEKLLPVLRTVANDTGVAVVIVEQHIHMALDYADRAYVLSHGRLAESGDCADLRTRKDLLEANYLGEAAL